MLRHIVGLIGLLLWIGATGAGLAQEDPRQAQLLGWNTALDRVEAALKQPNLSHGDLDRIYGDALAIIDGANALQGSLAPEIAQVGARLTALAKLPGAAAPEPEIVTKGRADQQALLEQLNGLDQQANIVASRASEFVAAIDAERSQRFAHALFVRDRSLLSPVVWNEIVRTIPLLFDRLGQRTKALSGRFAASTGPSVLSLVITIAVLLVLAALAGMVILRRAFALDKGGPPNIGRRMIAASCLLIVYVGGPILVLAGARELLFRGSFPPSDPLFDLVARAILSLSTLLALATGLLAPARPEWRIARMPDRTARAGFRLIMSAGLTVVIMNLIQGLSHSAPPLPDPSVDAVLAVLTAVLVVLAVKTIAKGDAPDATRPAMPHPRWSWLLPAASLAAIVVIAAALIGYLAFAAFLAEQIAWVWAIVGLVALGIGLVDSAATSVFSHDGLIGRSMTASFVLSHSLLDQLAIVVGGLGRLLILLLGILAIASSWGVESTDLAARLAGISSGLQIGSITISFQSIFAAVGLFIAVLVVGRLFHTWLGNRLLPATSLDTGLKDSILTVVSYAGVIAAVIAALAYAGIGLANIAIVAGALSVGIGFGLQSIVGNFVSGLILLAERPIRAGDWIEVGNDRGTVRRISVRATEITTPDRASVMIPNSNLISGVVKNISLRDASGRVVIRIGVAYDSDPEKVRQILLARAQAHPQVLADPPAYVVFLDFGASSLDFELNCFIADNRCHNVVVSDLRFAILKALREDGIEIPFPQQDLNLRDWPKIEAAVLRLLGKAAGDGPTSTRQSREPSS